MQFATVAHFVIISNQFDIKNLPTPHISRKVYLDAAYAKIKIKPINTEHIMHGVKLTQFTRLTFENAEQAQKFITAWVLDVKPKNALSQPLFAKPDVPSEIRKLRFFMINAEKTLKAYLRKVSITGRVRVKWQKHELCLDDRVVAKRLCSGDVLWTDEEIFSKINISGCQTWPWSNLSQQK